MSNKKVRVVEILLVLLLIGDLIVFWWATDRPQGLAPADPNDKPQLVNTPIEAASAASLTAAPSGGRVLFPLLPMELASSNGSSLYEVLAFGRREKDLYLYVRLHQSLDLSLEKGWGKAFQVVGDNGKRYFYDVASLPNAVEIHDTFVDLPNNFRARQTVVPGGYRDLFLAFPTFPPDVKPASLLVVEDFLGNSPANPGITYEQAVIAGKGTMQDIGPLAAVKPGERKYTGSGKAGDGINLTVKGINVDHLSQWQVYLEVSSSRQERLIINDAVLIDTSGRNYNLIQMEDFLEVIPESNGVGVLNLLFEPLPETVTELEIWLKFTTPEGETAEARFPMVAG
ncbi:hypothetical protein [Moorella sulfitireducens (nom. illeg.)]|uniref:hypothetical protein n=1 Tax=Neomoorella sulfitireducens TaxID=2972948 RepID=UPI0021ACBDD5|nr:hypothetical protein [Moorella sulfitireducens]